jgi:DNA-binding Lrp family transcriptional regulator
MTVFVRVSLAEHTQQAIGRFERAVGLCDLISECYLLSGACCYLLKINEVDSQRYENIHRRMLIRLPGVDRLTSEFVIRRVVNPFAELQKRTLLSAEC